jgi:hypothetical protein
MACPRNFAALPFDQAVAVLPERRRRNVDREREDLFEGPRPNPGLCNSALKS